MDHWIRLSIGVHSSICSQAHNTQAKSLAEMKLYHGVTLAMIFAQSSAAPAVKWSPCPVTTFDLGVQSGITDLTKCAVYTAPLCHPGVCETADSSKTTIDVFVKHLPGTKVKPEKTPNVWLLQGGPMHNPAALDMPMLMLYDKLAGEANVYTMDYRGTGRGEQLSCQAVTTGSSRLNDITPSQVPDCAQELQDKYGDLALLNI
ncbi:Hypothetical protein PHPALM_15405 [Phytophthora palmivora]|uniref:Serine protease family S33 n=1 Tax=Phytophthora palmivora TaxID=4796 RepID=A0A2P4XS89_9STRA|nr:Hypothetical protein PHPALM_15405 [Phytophthora palmivora]